MTTRIISNGRVFMTNNPRDTFLPSYLRSQEPEHRPLENIHVHDLLRQGKLSASESARMERALAKDAWEDALKRGIAARPADDPRAPFRDGTPMKDAHEDLVYRVLDSLNPLDGWASSEFWQDRYQLEHKDIVTLVQYGLMDAAVAKHSELRRYRVRDERYLKESTQFQKLVSSAKTRRTRLLAKSANGNSAASPTSFIRRK
jgi:hypothetical protein